MKEKDGFNRETLSLAEALVAGGELIDVTNEVEWLGEMRVGHKGEILPVFLDEHVSIGKAVRVGDVVYSHCD